MKKTINPKNKELYEYMIEKNVDIILKGKEIDPNCYSIIFNKKGDVSTFPIPLNFASSPKERQELLSTMGSILKKNKVKVSMFLLVTTATAFKKDDLNDRRECLIFSARDSLDNQRFSMFNVNRKDGKVSVELMRDGDSNGWKTKAEIKKTGTLMEDSLLHTIWKEYRKLK